MFDWGDQGLGRLGFNLGEPEPLRSVYIKTKMFTCWTRVGGVVGVRYVHYHLAVTQMRSHIRRKALMYFQGLVGRVDIWNVLGWKTLQVSCSGAHEQTLHLSRMPQSYELICSTNLICSSKRISLSPSMACSNIQAAIPTGTTAYQHLIIRSHLG